MYIVIVKVSLYSLIIHHFDSFWGVSYDCKAWQAEQKQISISGKTSSIQYWMHWAKICLEMNQVLWFKALKQKGSIKYPRNLYVFDMRERIIFFYKNGNLMHVYSQVARSWVSTWRIDNMEAALLPEERTDLVSPNRLGHVWVYHNLANQQAIFWAGCKDGCDWLPA